MMRKFLLMAALCAFPGLAFAALSPAALNSAGVSLPPNAMLPLNLSARDLSGQKLSLASAFQGKPGFALFADYTCKTLCGPALVLLGAGLTQSGLSPASYRLVVIGLDPKDTAGDARRMLMTQVPESIRPQTRFLLTDPATVSAATRALGFHYVYDKVVDQFAHPEVAYAVAADGRVLRVLSPLALTATDLKSALTGPPHTDDTLYGRFRVLCYRFGVLSGVYDAPVQTALKAAGGLTLVAMAAGLVTLLRRKRSRWT